MTTKHTKKTDAVVIDAAPAKPAMGEIAIGLEYKHNEKPEVVRITGNDGDDVLFALRDEKTLQYPDTSKTEDGLWRMDRGAFLAEYTESVQYADKAHGEVAGPTDAHSKEILAIVERLNKLQHKEYNVGIANAMKALSDAHGHLATGSK